MTVRDFVVRHLADARVLFALGTAGALQFVAELLLARGLSTEAYGHLAFALAVTVLVVPVADWGQANLVLARRGPIAAYGRRAMRNTALSAVMAWAAATAVAGTLNATDGGVSRHAIPTILFAYVSGRLLTVQGQRLGSPPWIALGNSLPKVSLVAAGGLALLTSELHTAGFAIATVAGGTTLLAMIALNRSWEDQDRSHRDGLPEVAIEAVSDVPTLSEGIPYAVSAISYLAYFYVDQVLLGILSTPIDLAQYRVSVTVFSILLLLPRGLLQLAHERSYHLASAVSVHRVAQIWWNRRYLALAVSGVAGLGLLGLAELVPLVFGSGYEGSVGITRVLSLAMISRAISNWCGAAASVRRMIHRKSRVLMGGAVLNIWLNVVLIPEYGALGAAWATVSSETAVMLLLGSLLYREHRLGVETG